MNSKIWYTARVTFDPNAKAALGWDKYIKWSKLTHLTEVISLDGILNSLVFEPDLNSKEDWKYIVTEGQMITRYFNTIDYIIEKTKNIDHFNLLAVIKEPKENKGKLSNNFDFIGYDLIERDGMISALTNCGGFDETFLPKDLNEYGLVTEWANAKKIQTNLKVNNPNEPHADCYLYEVWRHKTIGRKK